MIENLYLFGQGIASVWHHHHLSEAKIQTRYGAAQKDENGDYFLSWDHKGVVLGMMNGFASVVAERMQKEGKLANFVKSVEPLSFVGEPTFEVPHKKVTVDLEKDDFTSCRVNDLP